MSVCGPIGCAISQSATDSRIEIGVRHRKLDSDAHPSHMSWASRSANMSADCREKLSECNASSSSIAGAPPNFSAWRCILMLRLCTDTSLTPCPMIAFICCTARRPVLDGSSCRIVFCTRRFPPCSSATKSRTALKCTSGDSCASKRSAASVQPNASYLLPAREVSDSNSNRIRIDALDDVCGMRCVACWC
eukprot:933267-Rhodomonas_salina.9